MVMVKDLIISASYHFILYRGVDYSAYLCRLSDPGGILRATSSVFNWSYMNENWHTRNRITQ